jgi:GTP:adenosylcobinamide-phosphate guanylyltransferase
MNRVAALVLAGTRAAGDPLAAHAGVSHKALIETGGATMIERVVGALAAVPAVARIVVAIERPGLLSDLPGLRPPACAKPLATMAPLGGPSATVAAALASEGAPLLVTTADHALLRPQWVEEFMRACPERADVAVALAPRAAVQAAVPHTRRTWLRFADGDFSGCNLFLLAQPAARGVVTFWRQMEAERKNPLAMIRRLGWSYALRYRLGRLDRAAAARRVGELSGGARLAFVDMSDGRCAIDVDTVGDLELVRSMLAPPVIASAAPQPGPAGDSTNESRGTRRA